MAVTRVYQLTQSRRFSRLLTLSGVFSPRLARTTTPLGTGDLAKQRWRRQTEQTGRLLAASRNYPAGSSLDLCEDVLRRTPTSAPAELLIGRRAGGRGPKSSKMGALRSFALQWSCR